MPIPQHLLLCSTPGTEQAESPTTDEAKPVKLRCHEDGRSHVVLNRDGKGHAIEGQPSILPIYPVHIREQQDPAAEEGKHHDGPIHFMKKGVLLFVL